MSIKPIDFQLSIPRTTEVSRVRGEEMNKEAAQQHMQEIITQNQADNSMRQVQKRDKAEEARIRQEEERKNNQKDNNNKKDSDGKKQTEKDKKDVGKYSTSTFDIKI